MMPLLAPLVAALLAGCSGEPAPVGPTLTPVKLALNWYPEPEFGGFYEGVLGGHYAEAGFEVTIVPGGPGAPTLELLQSGQADAAITAADDLLVKRHRGVKAVGAWPAFQLSPQGLMAHEASGVDGFDDIGAGRRVAIEVGSPFQQYLWRRFGWEGAVEPVPYGGSVGPFLQDPALVQQAYITAEPCVARAKGAEVRFLKASEAGWNPYGTLLAFSDPPPAWAPQFVAATQAAWIAYNRDPSRANAEIARLNDQLDEELLRCVTEAQRPFLTGDDGLGPMTAARWDAINGALIDIGLLPMGAKAEGAWAPLWPAPDAPAPNVPAR